MNMRYHRQEDYTPLMNVAAAFAVGVIATWLLARALERRRGPRETAISDDVLRERVRARVADLVARPDAVDVLVEGGVVRLSGRVLASERDLLLSDLIDLPGVARLRNALSPLHE
jgi:osmotically-inducible protein OsmY